MLFSRLKTLQGSVHIIQHTKNCFTTVRRIRRTVKGWEGSLLVGTGGELVPSKTRDFLLDESNLFSKGTTWLHPYLQRHCWPTRAGELRRLTTPAPHKCGLESESVVERVLGSPRGKVRVPGQTPLLLIPTLLITFLIRITRPQLPETQQMPLPFFHGNHTVLFPPKRRWDWRGPILLTQARETVSHLVQMAVPRTRAGQCEHSGEEAFLFPPASALLGGHRRLCTPWCLFQRQAKPWQSWEVKL